MRTPLEGERAQFVLLWLGLIVVCASLAHFYSRAVVGQYALERVEPMRIDLNKADAGRLCHLPGVGPTLAERIVRERREDGPFHDFADLQERVDGIGPSTCLAMQEFVSF